MFDMSGKKIVTCPHRSPSDVNAFKINDIRILQKIVDDAKYISKFYDNAVEQLMYAGGAFTHAKLDDMTVREFACICGRNNLELKYIYPEGRKGE